MKKLILVILTALSVFLVSCGKENDVVEKADRPPAFSILQKETVLRKHSEKGKDVSFSHSEFENFLGEKLTYITVNSLPEAEKGSLICKGAPVVKGETVVAEDIEYLRFIPNKDCESASFGFTADSAGYYGSEMVCDIVYGDSVNSPPVTVNSEMSTVENISCEGKLSITEPNGDDYEIKVITYPKGGYISFSDGGKVVYTPEDGFSGKDVMVYSVKDRYGAVSERATVTITVNENEKGINFADMKDDINHIYAYNMCENDTMVYRYENGSYYFDPDIAVSKLDFLVMMMTVSGHSSDVVAVADSAITDDSGLSSGLKGYLSAAAEKGFIKLENGKFAPKDKITLSEAAYIIANALKLPAVNGPDGKNSPLAAVVKAGIIDAVNGTVDGSKVLTKSEIAQILCRCENYITKNNIFRETD